MGSPPWAVGGSNAVRVGTRSVRAVLPLLQLQSPLGRPIERVQTGLDGQQPTTKLETVGRPWDVRVESRSNSCEISPASCRSP
jgi:hypothetical protein